MLEFFQPVASLCVGLALSVYGLVQTILHRPDRSVFQVFIEHFPSMLAVFVFVLGLFAAVSGIALLVHGWRGLRERLAKLNRIYRSPYPTGYEDEHDPYEPRYP